MLLDANGRVSESANADELLRALGARDSRGGGQLWLSDERGSFPCLAVRLSGDLADAHHFPQAGHPGYRCVGRTRSTAEPACIFVFEGCDPGTGERVPAEFVLSLSEVSAVLAEFSRTRGMSAAFTWIEL